MAPPKRFWARLKLSPKFLGTLPEFPTYMSKSRLKRLAQEERRSASASLNGSQRSSPAPEGGNGNGSNYNNNNGGGNNNGGSTISNYKVNMDLKEGSTSGLTMNSITSGQYALDKSGKPCKRWVKKPRQFKSFTGFKVTYVAFEPKDAVDKQETKQEDVEIKEESVSNISTEAANTPVVTPAPTPDIPLLKTES
ncbi:hypothetical protein K6H10_005290 [Candida tropicalis]